MECRESVHADYRKRFRDLRTKLIWERRSTRPATERPGQVTLSWPWKILDMWRWTKAVNSADYQFDN
ncbi:MAG: hypothetical protein R3E50_01210 [Halioglobus sp.]